MQLFSIPAIANGISYELAYSLLDHDIALIPGQRVCRQCCADLQSKVDEPMKDDDPPPGPSHSEPYLSDDTEPASDSSQVDDMFTSGGETSQIEDSSQGEDEEEPARKRKKSRESANKLLAKLGVSPLTMHNKRSEEKPKVIAEKTFKAAINLNSALAKAASTQPSQIDLKKFKENETLADDMRDLVERMKSKLQLAENRREKVQVLTLIPKSWSRQKACSEFSVPERMVRDGMELRDRVGILTMPATHKRQRIHEDTLKAVHNWYNDDNNSRQLPGLKDCVSVQGVKHPKRLILCKLSELHQLFKEDHPGMKIGFSKFTCLRPKWCVLAGGKGTHIVCTCLHHENAKLLASETGHDYKVPK